MDTNRIKRLTVVRHGKATDAGDADDDHARELVKKGAKDLRRLTRVLQRLDSPVDLLVTSPALRAVQSAEVLADCIGYDDRLLVEDEIYGATPATLLHVVSNLPESAEHVLVVGHNPGLEGLISGLCAGSSLRLNMHLSTGGLAHMGLEIYWWQQVRWGCGELQLFVNPKRMPKG